jgi:hypothetical protein
MLLALPLLVAVFLSTRAQANNPAYTVPNTADLLFGFNTENLPASGNTGNVNAFAPVGGVFNTIGTPTVDNVGSPSAKWEKNVAFTMGYFNAWTWTTPVAVNGVTAVAVVKPVRSSNLRNWTPVIDVLFGAFRLGVRNDNGRVILTRSNPSGAQTQVDSTTSLPEGQSTVLSAVVQANGSYEVWANGVSIMTGGALSGGVTSLTNGTRRLVCIGTSQDDTSATFNGNIGDVFMWKVALDSTSRTTLEADLMAKFRAGAAFLSGTITPSSSGGGGSISPAVATTVQYEADQTFTITRNFGYVVDVVVDGVSQGNIDSYTFNDSVGDHTIAANFSALPTRTISGNVVAAPGGGATVSVKLTGASLPSLQTTTDASGNFTMTVPEGIYAICASQTGFVISPDSVSTATGDQTINFTLSAGRGIPQMESLLFAADSTSLGALGTAGNWSLLHSTYPAISQLTAINTPVVTKVRGIKYALNQRAVPEDGYRLNTALASSPIPTSGASVVTVVRPIRNSTGDPWNSVVDIFRDNLILGVKNNTGQIQVRRNGVDFWSTNDAAGTLANDQLAILSLIVEADGQFKVWCSRWNSTTNQFGTASVILSSTATSAFNAFVPAQAGVEDWRRWINLGRNNGDGWTSFNGYIGDTFVYKTALSDANRAALEVDINAKTTAIPVFSITATTDANGTISPAGVTGVGESDNQTYTITPNFGYDIATVLVNGVNNTGAVSSGTFTFTNVTTAHTIDATFTAKPAYAISGTVTDGTNPIAGAKVYVSSSTNASFNPTYTLTTDSGGNYSVNLFNGTWYVCASAMGYTTSADITTTVNGVAQAGANFALAASGRNIPQMDQLLFALYGSSLTANGATTNPWPLEHPAGRTAPRIGTPTLATVDGLQWESNRYASADGYTIGSYSAPIPITGLTATAVIQPQGDGTNGGNWTSIIDVLYNRFILGIRGTDGVLRVARNGVFTNGPAIPNGQKTILTAVVQPTGQYVVYANGIQVMQDTSISPMTSLDPYWNGGGLGFWSSITVGRNAPDGWTTYNGNIGAAMLWKTALLPAQRAAFETELGTTFGITVSVLHTITATAGTGGTISPSGAITVNQGSNQSFSITPSPGYVLQSVVVDGTPEAIPSTSYTFTNVTEPHTIHATFTQSDGYGQWATTNFPSGGANAAKGADPDFDGSNNLMEYAFGTNPTSSTVSPLSYTPGVSGTIIARGQPIIIPNTLNPPNFSAVFGRRWHPAPTGLVYTVQFSANLSQWVNVTPSANAQDVRDLEIEVVEVPFPATIDPGTGPVVPKFFRVLVTEAP